MTFTTTPLVSGGVLVEGTDSKGNDGSCILQSDRWDAVVHYRKHESASDEFDTAVREFFAPLTDAADKAKAELTGTVNEFASVTLNEGVEGEAPVVIDLDEAGILLRILEAGSHDKLRWIENGSRLVAVV